MRRVTVFTSFLAFVFVGVFALGAQEGTQSEEGSERSEGLAFELLAVGTADELPAAPADLSVFRLTIESGVVLPLDPADPTTSLIYVESGTLTLRVDVPLVVRRASIPATAVPGAGDEGEPARERVAADTEVTLAPGDSFVVPPDSAGEVRSDGTEPLVLLIAAVAPRQ